MYFFSFLFVGLLMVNHFYILVLWKNSTKKAQILIWTALS